MRETAANPRLATGVRSPCSEPVWGRLAPSAPSTLASLRSPCSEPVWGRSPPSTPSILAGVCSPCSEPVGGGLHLRLLPFWPAYAHSARRRFGGGAGRRAESHV